MAATPATATTTAERRGAGGRAGAWVAAARSVLGVASMPLKPSGQLVEGGIDFSALPATLPTNAQQRIRERLAR